MNELEHQFLAAVAGAKRYTEVVKAGLVSGELHDFYTAFLDELVEAARVARPPVEVSVREAAWRRGVVAYKRWLAAPGLIAQVANDA